MTKGGHKATLVSGMPSFEDERKNLFSPAIKEKPRQVDLAGLGVLGAVINENAPGPEIGAVPSKKWDEFDASGHKDRVKEVVKNQPIASQMPTPTIRVPAIRLSSWTFPVCSSSRLRVRPPAA